MRREIQEKLKKKINKIPKITTEQLSDEVKKEEEEEKKCFSISKL